MPPDELSPRDASAFVVVEPRQMQPTLLAMMTKESKPRPTDSHCWEHVEAASGGT